MPLLTLMAVLAVAQTSEAPSKTEAQPQAGPIISKMFAKYYDAKTLTGKVMLVQGVGNESGKLETILQYERPGLIYIKQTLFKKVPEVWLTCSDGKMFSYDVPKTVPSNRTKRLMERQIIGTTTLTIADIYHAALDSLGDRSPILDMVIAAPDDLKYVKQQWASISLEGTVDFKGEKVYAITGQWRAYETAVVDGKFRMLISQGYELKQYTVTETVSFGTAMKPQPVVSSWNVDLKINGTPDKSLFQVVK